MAKNADKTVARTMLEIAAASRLLWPRQRRPSDGAQRPLTATEKQVLILVWENDFLFDRREAARRLAVTESAIHHAMGELVRRELVLSAEGETLRERTIIIDDKGMNQADRLVKDGRATLEQIGASAVD